MRNVVRLAALLALLSPQAQAANPIWLQNLGQGATGTNVSSSYGLDVNVIGGTLTTTEGATAADGADDLPAVLKIIGGWDGNDIRAIKTDTDGAVQVDVESSALPSGAATSAKQDTGNTSLASIDGKVVLPASLGQKTMANSLACALSSDQSAIPVTGTFWQATQPVSGTFWQATQPVSIATAPVLVAGSAVIGKVGIDQTTPGTTNLVALADNQSVNVSQINGVTPLMGAGNTGTGSHRVTIATDQAAIATKAPLNTTGSGSAAGATVSTVITLSKPSNAVGFILMNIDTSTTNLRWALGRTATTTLGQQLQPGRDTGFIPASVDVSIVAESGTVTYDIQWVSQ